MIKRAFLLLGIVAFAFCYIPPPSPAPAQFAGQAQWARAASTGSANAQSVALPNYNLNVGVPITFVVGTALSNTAATTVNINGTGAVNVKRMTNVGIADLVGGEFLATNQVTVVYDGTQYRLVGPIYQVGVIAIFRGNVDDGWQVEDGTCLNSTLARNVALFAKIGTIYGNCGANSFLVPDSRGRLDAATDNQGVNGQAFRITNCTFVGLGAVCGNQNAVIQNTSQFPPYTPGGNISSFTPSGTVSVSLSSLSNGVLNNQNVGGNANVTGGGGAYQIGVLTASGSFTGNSITPTFTGSAVGTSQPIPSLSPVLAAFRAIKL